SSSHHVGLALALGVEGSGPSAFWYSAVQLVTGLIRRAGGGSGSPHLTGILAFDVPCAAPPIRAVTAARIATMPASTADLHLMAYSSSFCFSRSTLPGASTWLDRIQSERVQTHTRCPCSRSRRR